MWFVTTRDLLCTFDYVVSHARVCAMNTDMLKKVVRKWTFDVNINLQTPLIPYSANTLSLSRRKNAA